MRLPAQRAGRTVSSPHNRRLPPSGPYPPSRLPLSDSPPFGDPPSAHRSVSVPVTSARFPLASSLGHTSRSPDPARARPSEGRASAEARTRGEPSRARPNKKYMYNALDSNSGNCSRFELESRAVLSIPVEIESNCSRFELESKTVALDSTSNR